MYNALYDPNAISIHASTQEATRTRRQRLLRSAISIHASTQEATYGYGPERTGTRISIHASTQEATWIVSEDRLLLSISIHASTQEATYGKRLQRIINSNFNPRFHAGSDSNYRQILSITFVHFAYFFLFNML